MIKKINKKRKGFDRTSKLLPKTLYKYHVKEIFKSFGVQSLVGGTGRRTGLKNQRFTQNLAGSSFFTEIPYPAHLPYFQIK